MQNNFSNWADKLIETNQLNLKDTLTFRKQDGTTFKKSIGEIFDFVNEKLKPASQEKFMKNVDEGVAVGNIVGYIYGASKKYDFDGKEQEKTKEQKPVKEQAQENQTIISFRRKEPFDKTDWAREHEEKAERAKQVTINQFVALETNLKNPKTQAKAQQEFNEFLSQMSRSYEYSANNVMLISAQLRDRGLENTGIVKSQADWEKMGVKVRQEGLIILTPTKAIAYEREKVATENGEKWIYKLDDEGKKIPKLNEKGEQEYVTYFNMDGKVFDASMTNAFESGKLQRPSNNKIPANQITNEAIDVVCAKIANELGVDLNIRPLEKDSYFKYEDKKYEIHINANLSNEEQFNALMREVGNKILHTQDTFNKKDYDEARRKGEAESFAYVLAEKFGVEAKTSNYIAEYLRAEEAKPADKREDIKDVLTDIMKAVQYADYKLNLDKLAADFKNATAQAQSETQLNSENLSYDEAFKDIVTPNEEVKEETKSETKDTETNAKKNTHKQK
ncbi:ImmA/IrrE family metallo-endopeptidase [Campylobacter concisus]|uniref:ImmA/IrrE family metallo-endopeptidase n=1 Tax=Campylobacter concisus TaxID=199 RepID=UPI000CD8EABB|nr:ImmA/IrrE family metallo-endopeptidase [Campylobacter concisus]